MYSRERAIGGKLVYPLCEKDPGAARRNRLKDSSAHVGLKSKVELAGSPRNRVKSTTVLIEVVVVRQQRMKVATREQSLFVLIEGMKGFFVYLLSFRHHSSRSTTK